MSQIDDLVNFIDSEVSLDPGIEIVGDTDLLLTGLVDSLGVIQIVHWLEENSDVTIDPVDVILDNFQTIDQMISFVKRLRQPTH